MSVVLHGRSHTAHNASRVPKSKGPRVSRDRGPPQVNRGFLRSGVFQNPTVSGLKGRRFFFLGLRGPRVEGLTGLKG